MNVLLEKSGRKKGKGDERHTREREELDKQKAKDETDRRTEEQAVEYLDEKHEQRDKSDIVPTGSQVDSEGNESSE